MARIGYSRLVVLLGAGLFGLLGQGLASEPATAAAAPKATIAAQSAGVARSIDGRSAPIAKITLSKSAAAATNRAFVRGSYLKGRSGGLEFTCNSIVCVCTGDDDCNQMFSTICSSPSTGGTCTEINGVTVCACTPH